MKILTDSEVIELLPADKFEGVEQMNKVLIACGENPADWVNDAVKRGFLHCTNVKVKGEPLYAFAWHVTDQNQICFNAGAFIGKIGSGNSEIMLRAMELICAQQKAIGMIITTLRAGVVTLFKSDGWKIGGVMLEKNLT